MGHLTKWDQRGCNALAILLTGAMSLCIGSLLGYLGSMMRWPILAGAAHTAEDVDSILGMGSPAGALRMITKNVYRRKWTRTTSIVAAFVFVNIAGRLSVAFFGLTFNLAEVPGVYHPIMVSNWTAGPDDPSPRWIAFPHTDPNSMSGTGSMRLDDYLQYPGLKGTNVNRLLEFAQLGISSWTKHVNVSSFHDGGSTVPDDVRISKDIFGIQGMDIQVDNYTVKYSYSLRERRLYNSTPTPLENIIRSSASCKTIYVDGNQTFDIHGKLHDTLGFGCLGHIGEQKLFWVKDVPQLGQYCELCLTDRNNQPGVGNFYGVPDEHKSFNTRTLLIFPASVDNYSTISTESDLMFNYLPNARLRLLSANSELWDVETELYKYHLLSTNDTFLNNSFERYARVFAASLNARMPVLAIAAADNNNQLPQASKDGTTERQFVIKTLEVKWRQFGITVGAIICGQTLAIAVVLQYCRNVHVRDDSYLSVARLLKTLFTKADGGTVGTGKELAACLDSLGPGFRYGTSASGDKLVLDCSDEVETSFLLGQLYEEGPKLRTE
ncbi:hypothetical protein K440DRAFT_682824 [Wilcoxina mikolae CBS 423.85]|nr:hypothetical protein K440DRAFT_682824 [Wilcoxina mikolae CBS 423.85]